MGILATIVCAILAKRKGRGIGRWIFGGLFLGWIAVIILCFSRDLSTPSARLYYGKRYSQTTRIHRCEKCGETVNTKQCPVCGTVWGVNKEALSYNTPHCPNCGDAMKGNVCDICGYQGEPVRSKPAAAPHKISKIAPYSCPQCGERIDTAQCPWCGYRKK